MARAEWQARDASERNLALAWQTAAFAVSAWNGKLPAFESMMADAMRIADRPSAAQQKARVEVLASHLGLSTKPLSPSTLRALARLKES